MERVTPPQTQAPHAPRGQPVIPQEASIVRMRRELHDTWTLDLELSGGRPLVFEPGQYNMIGLPGMGEAPITFSGGADGQFSHTIRAVGRVTGALATLRAGDMIQVRGPYGVGWPWKETLGKDVIILAGGTGIIPLRPLIHRALQQKEAVGKLTILFGARTPEDMLYREEAAAWAGAGADVRLIVDETVPTVPWRGPTGVVTSLLGHPSAGVPAQIAMVCGPELMMRFAVRELMLRGLRPPQIYVSLERRMECGIGHCGHCQIGPKYVCLDGPVFSYQQIMNLPDTML